MTEGARTSVPYTRASTKGQTDGGYSPRQQIESLLGWPESENHEVPVGQLGAESRGPGRSPDDA
jgi:hypothetical protein